jgi:hypothetical protein
MVRALGSQTVGLREVALQVAHVHRGKCGQLMDDHVRPRPRHRLRDLIGIKRVGDHQHRPQLGQHRPP